MKRKWLIPPKRNRWLLASPLAICMAAASALSAAEADTNAPPEKATAPESGGSEKKEAAALTPEQMFEGGAETYQNWIEFGVGGFFLDGNESQFQQSKRATGEAFGGIEDFHYQRDLAKGTTLKADGRALFDENDYRLSLDVTRDKLGYVRFSYSEFRNWSSPHGGFFPSTGAWYQRSDDALSLDRGEISFEAGLRLKKLPSVTFRYERRFREGEKASTIWGLAHPTDDTLVRGLSPTISEIDEHTDIFALDATHQIKATALGLGLRYETGEFDNALKIQQFPGEVVERKVTDRQGTTFDLFNIHAFTETWIRKNLLFSSGFAYSDLGNDFSGSRIYGSDFDIGYAPSALNNLGYYGMSGGSRLHEYVLNLNLLAKATKYLTIVPSIRVQREDTDADMRGTETFGTAAPLPLSANSERGFLDVRERLDLNYTRITNWVFHARAESTQGDGNLKERGGLAAINGVGVSPIEQDTDDSRFFQKYSAGVRWYPVRSVTLDAGGYYKNNKYDYDHEKDSTPNDGVNRYPAYLAMQRFETYDANLRLTLRPWRNLSLVSRYEHQWSTVETRPDSAAGLGEVESAEMTSHILAQDITWTPCSRLYLQVGFNYVLSETETPASDYTQAILDADNNYWTLNFTSGIVLDEKSDLKVGYSYYEADNREDSALEGVPLGAGASEHGVTATLTRKLTKNLRFTLKYGYFHYEDAMFGGNTDYDAHLVQSSLQYRF